MNLIVIFIISFHLSIVGCKTHTFKKLIRFASVYMNVCYGALYKKKCS
jgi:hypothetical protein